ncbi:MULTISPECIES: hypothetical protein [unclassified Brevundimonas]
MKRLVVLAALSVVLTGCGESGPNRAERRLADKSELERLVSTEQKADALTAIRLLENDYRVEIVEGGELHSLYEKAKATRLEAEKAEALEATRSRLKAQLETVNSISSAQPESMDQIRRNLRAFESAAQTLADAKDYPDAAVKTDSQRLRSALVQKQREVLPRMRAGFGKVMGREMWESDVEVIVQGSGNRTVRFIAGMFAANRNIAAGQRAADEVASQLRFKRTQFEWYRGSEYTYYTLDTPDDGAVGTWRGSYFTAVP